MTIPSTFDAGAAATGRALAAIPSPGVSSLSLGPLTIHFYALCILAGVIAAVIWSERRWAAMGGERGTIMDLAVPAVLLGLVGGRLYHVITDYQLYFGPGREPIRALYIWEGGLGIWGAIPLGALGVWLVARRRGLSMSRLSFAIAPTLPLAQAFGRWGNYFNQELFGAPTNLPWAVEISPFPTGALRPGMIPGEFTYHPTFLYESLWCLALAAVLAWAGRRFEMRGGRLFALYVMGYCVGRFWIEYLRVDPAHTVLGLRLNNWTSILVFLAALAYFVWAGRRLDRFSDQVRPVGPGTERTAAAPDATVEQTVETGQPTERLDTGSPASGDRDTA
ncbi:prolipoprotein diacylglyceryl transferase [Marinitenerispora sediminis]|uniref:Phosphatidylglycerol--prolipoprotein diacylglyceryl transferase n=1 Tax=Marinitenerispora sediminis TaxID=1931232 RepID=A0A368T1Y3_9ACTN|nr:prolipoprotein diacylglyceryl transferase [Marinitenerispora sediminis]RCV49331.1 prolipoprotein diacylglyceryl transferase [Marinitenerispora sediminis]RCV50736.1 prolipoprotein diacylglyceryl transferase [Marinitenerispora sediminis]RCV56334.1 prolipoprotein diacylglyceryl transferase [Marinitenerispora sediminis]